MIKKLLQFVILSLLCISCVSCNNNGESSMDNNTIIDVKRTSNVESYKWKQKKLIVYIKDTDGFLLLNNNEILDFNNIQKKTVCSYEINNELLEIIYIPIKPFVVLTYDDCVASDYDVYQIHQKYNAPAELAINLKGHTLSTDKIKEMCLSSDWELANHGWSHSCLQQVSLQQLHEIDHNKVYGWFSNSFQDGIEVQIKDDIYIVKSHGSDNQGTYFVVEPNFIREYPKGTKLRLSDKQLEIELFKDVDEFTKETSIIISNFTYPFTIYDDRTINLLSAKYNSARAYNDRDRNNKNLIDPGMNYFPFENRFELNSASFTNYYDKDEIVSMLKKAKETNALLIQYTHSWDTAFSMDQLEFFIQEANKLNLTITTRSKVWEYYELFN